MKTIMKRIAALVLIAAMAVMAVAGCSKSSGSKSAGNKSADTMFGLVKEAQALEKKTVEVSAEINTNGVKASVTLNGKSDGKATSVGATVTYGGVTFSLDDVIVFTDDVLYINAGLILEQIKPFINTAGEKAASVVEALGDLGWVSFEAKGLFATSSCDEVFDKDSYDQYIEDNMTVKYNRGSKDNLIQYEVSSQNGDRLAGEVEVNDVTPYEGWSYETDSPLSDHVVIKDNKIYVYDILTFVDKNMQCYYFGIAQIELSYDKNTNSMVPSGEISLSKYNDETLDELDESKRIYDENWTWNKDNILSY